MSIILPNACLVGCNLCQSWLSYFSRINKPPFNTYGIEVVIVISLTYLSWEMILENIKPVKSVARIINVLFVDDDPNFLDTTRRLFQRLGYIVTTAYNGSEAIDILKEYYCLFDIVITDYDMPGMNGVELAIAAREFTMNTPIVLFTGKIDLNEEIFMSRAGIVEVVRKPCRISMLDSIIRKIIDQERTYRCSGSCTKKGYPKILKDNK